MTIIKTLWSSVQADPTLMRRLNGWLTIFWIAMIPVSIMLGLLASVAYVSALSLWALVSGHWSAWQAARVEVAQSVEAHKLEEHPLEDRVVEQLIRETDVQTRPEQRGLLMRRHVRRRPGTRSYDDASTISQHASPTYRTASGRTRQDEPRDLMTHDATASTALTSTVEVHNVVFPGPATCSKPDKDSRRCHG